MLSNFDHNGVPLVQSFLLGQREFRGILRAPGLEQLRQRVIAAYHLKPLSPAEIKSYIEYRMRKVGWTDNPLIEEPVFQRIYDFTGGVPRRINTLFDRTLLNCYLDDSHVISPTMLDAVCAEILVEQGESGDDVDDKPEGWEPVRVVTAESADESSRKGELAEMETRLVSMQHVIEDLTTKLVAAQQPAPLSLPQQSPDITDSASRFPWWTTAFLVALIVLAATALSVGYWLMAKH